MSLVPGKSTKGRKIAWVLGVFGSLGLRLAVHFITNASAPDGIATFQQQRANACYLMAHLSLLISGPAETHRSGTSSRYCMAKDCVYQGIKFEDGSIACQEGHEFRCRDGQWEALGSNCSEAGPPPAVAKEQSADQETPKQ